MATQITLSKEKLFSGGNVELKIRKYSVEKRKTTKLNDVLSMSRGWFGFSKRENRMDLRRVEGVLR